MEVNGKTSTCIFFHELGQHERGMTWMKGWATPTCRISCSGKLPLRATPAQRAGCPQGSGLLHNRVQWPRTPGVAHRRKPKPALRATHVDCLLSLGLFYFSQLAPKKQHYSFKWLLRRFGKLAGRKQTGSLGLLHPYRLNPLCICAALAQSLAASPLLLPFRLLRKAQGTCPRLLTGIRSSTGGAPILNLNKDEH